MLALGCSPQLPWWLKESPKRAWQLATLRRVRWEGLGQVVCLFTPPLFFDSLTLMAQMPLVALPGTRAQDLFPRNMRGRPPAMQRFCLLVFLFFFVVLFYSLCFCFVWKSPQRLFSCSFRVSSFCVPPKPVFEILFFFLFRFVSLFSFCPPFQIPYIPWFLSVNPFWTILYFWFLLSLFCCLCLCSFLLVFSNKLSEHPFLKPKLFACLAVSLVFLLFLILFSCFMFLPFCFYVGFVFGMFKFCSCYVFFFCFLCCFQTIKNIVFLQI